MKVGIHQPNFLPWAGFFKKIHASDIFVFLDTAKCSKNSFFNRNRFSADKNFKSSFWLSCPIGKDSYSKKILDVECNTSNLKKHIKHLKMRHSKTRETKFLDSIINHYEKKLSHSTINLSNFNIDLIKIICDYLEIDTKLVKSSSLSFERDAKNQYMLIEIINLCDGKTYISGQGAKNYQSEQVFENHGIELAYMENQFDLPVIEDNHISVVDLILHEGLWKVKKTILA